MVAPAGSRWGPVLFICGARGARESGRFLSWDQAICAAWWRWAGHAARLAEKCPERVLSKILGWKDAWWRQTLRYVYGGSQSRLGRGDRMLGRRRWGEPIQQVVNSDQEGPWQTKALDSEAWAEFEAAFIARAARIPRDRLHAIRAGTCSSSGCRHERHMDVRVVIINDFGIRSMAHPFQIATHVHTGSLHTQRTAAGGASKTIL